ncbi:MULTISPECIES: flagellin N-terminal helical domain-containing protein [Bacillaceae]|uniref:Flagellin n=1 Tax=Mesobacillus boroniphilus JCM 21738 TaxID=1294265 RepID=W4RHY8_9BACI|nr:flagellin protein FlaA [Mesobacillus boroniphilus JCM 21738]
MEKLSSGLRINKAGDDAAGLAISEKMRGQIRGLDMASKNAQDANSLLATAEGALNETHSILQRMRELSVQASNDTNTVDDRSEIQKEIDQLTDEIDRIGNTTEFNTKKLLNGGAGVQATVTDQSGVALTTGGVAVVGGGAGIKAGGQLDLNNIKAAESASMIFDGTAAITIGTDTSFSVNGVTINLNAGGTGADIASAVNNVSGQTGVTATYDSAAFKLTFSTTAVGSDAQLDVSGLTLTDAVPGDTFTSTAAIAVTDQNGTDLLTANVANADITSIIGDDATATLNAATTGADPTSLTFEGNKITVHGGDYDGLELKVASTETAGTTNVRVKIDANNSLNFQIGANEDQEMNVSILDMRATALGVNNLDVTSQVNAKAAITTIDDAIKSVSAERSKLGAVQNRLEHTINNLGTSSENLTAAESRIRDVDYALAA